MTDHDHERELLKWVAEELLGWTFCESPSRVKGTERWACILFEKPAQWYQIEETLESWRGIGLVVEAMGKRIEIESDEYSRFINILDKLWNNFRVHWWEMRPAWTPLFVAARKAVTND